MRFLLYVMIGLSHLQALKVEMTQGTVQPDPICVAPFIGATEISKIVSDDLESSGLYRALDPQGFIQSGNSLMEKKRVPSMTGRFFLTLCSPKRGRFGSRLHTTKECDRAGS